MKSIAKRLPKVTYWLKWCLNSENEAPVLSDWYVDINYGWLDGSKGEGKGGLYPPSECHFAKRSKWLRIGCRLGQNLRNFFIVRSYDFNYLSSVSLIPCSMTELKSINVRYFARTYRLDQVSVKQIALSQFTPLCFIDKPALLHAWWLHS